MMFKGGVWGSIFWCLGSGSGGGRRDRCGRFCWLGYRCSGFEGLFEGGSVRELSLEGVYRQE